MRARITGTLVVLIAMMSMVATATAAPSDTGAEKRAEHQRVIDYWTAERIASAIPRDMVRVGGPVQPMAKPPGTPGGGGGNGGGNGGGGDGGGDDGGSAIVTGEPWTKGGLVKETTGKVLFTLPGGNYVCSGSLVDDDVATHSLVLTAGHCVLDESNNTFATNWIFFPDFESDPDLKFDCNPAICFVAEGLVTTTQWSNRDFDHDYGFAALAPNPDGDLAEDLYGTQSIAFNQGSGRHVFAFGYPHAPPYDGNDLIHCAGDTKKARGRTTTQGVTCNMTGGSSGGPWFTGFDSQTGTGTLYSVNSYKFTNDPNTMYGPYLGSGAEKTYNHANTAPVGYWLVNAN